MLFNANQVEALNNLDLDKTELKKAIKKAVEFLRLQDFTTCEGNNVRADFLYEAIGYVEEMADVDRYEFINYLKRNSNGFTYSDMVTNFTKYK